MRILISFLFLIATLHAHSQDKYWVFLKDKDGVTFDPYSYFDAKAIERRMREGVNLYDPTDFPLRQDYLNTVTSSCDSICGVSRWFNAIACSATEQQIKRMERFDFVKSIQKMCSTPVLASNEKSIVLEEDTLDVYESILYAQTERMQYSLLREKGYTGKGVRVAILDAGFPEVNTNDCFSHIMKHKRIVATYDFVRNKENVYRASNHGTHVLSCIAGIKEEVPMGCATDAEFLLARTENAFIEIREEEDNWIESLEWADKMGADIVNSSLGYTVQFYFRDEMNGQVSIISRAANMALSKGILVVNSAGNEGDESWEIIGSPADADSVLTIGGIEPWTGMHTGFSSYGPTSDLRMKPNLSAFSFVVTALGRNTGTSFSSPLVAGFAACIRQMHPEWTAKQLFDELEKSGNLHPYFDYAHGFGVPQASYFLNGNEKKSSPAFRMEWDKEENVVKVFETKLASDSSTFSEIHKQWFRNFCYDEPLDYLYWQIVQPDGLIKYYEVVQPGNDVAAVIHHSNCPQCTVRMSYKGAFMEIPWALLVMQLNMKRPDESNENLEPND